MQIELWDYNAATSDVAAAYAIIKETDCIVSFSASTDNSRLLLNMANRALHMWTLPLQDGFITADMVQKFRGASERHSRFVPTPLGFSAWCLLTQPCTLLSFKVLYKLQIGQALCLKSIPQYSTNLEPGTGLRPVGTSHANVL